MILDPRMECIVADNLGRHELDCWSAARQSNLLDRDIEGRLLRRDLLTVPERQKSKALTRANAHIARLAIITTMTPPKYKTESRRRIPSTRGVFDWDQATSMHFATANPNSTLSKATIGIQ